MKYKKIGLPNIKTHPHLKDVIKSYNVDEVYIVYYSKIDKYIHLRIRRIDDKPVINYMDIQQIKDDLLGKNVEAIQVFPKRNDFIDNSNTYHIWTWKGIKIPNLKKLYEYKK